MKRIPGSQDLLIRRTTNPSSVIGIVVHEFVHSLGSNSNFSLKNIQFLNNIKQFEKVFGTR